MFPASRIIALLIAATISLHAEVGFACSQCLCGTPFPSDVLGGVVPMQLRYGFEDRYLSKSNALEEAPGVEKEREHRVSGFVLWRAVDRLALLGRVPYNFKEITAAPLGEAAEKQTSRGIGDADLLALIGVAHTSGPHATTVGAVLGVTAPTGSNDLKDSSGERLDVHLQPGAGAWSGTGGVNVTLSSASGIFDASVLERVNGTSSHGYRYGNVMLYNLGYASPLHHGLALLAQLNGRTAERDRFEDGTNGENTGGTVVYGVPGVRWQSSAGIGIEAAIQIPIHKSLHGEQNEHTTGRLAVSLNH